MSDVAKLNILRNIINITSIKNNVAYLLHARTVTSKHVLTIM
jgi:hypothetical protein